MCTSPIRIVNPSKWLAPDRGQQLWLYVPCGHCAECREQKKNEWRIRTYYECVDCMRNGYALFDTLTYSNDYLPHVNDYIDVPKDLNFSCFRSDDIVRFFKRLRIRLKRLGFDPKDKLRYFLASEYGTSQGRTHRPHYHVIFFVRDNFVDNITLSQCISAAWSVDDGFGNISPIGRTDGIPYKSSSYVNFHNTFKSVDLSQKRVVMYVAKYVAKDIEYSSMVRKRLYELMRWYYPDFDFSQFSDRKLYGDRKMFYDQLCNFVLPFHRQSLHFGDYYIQYFGRENLIRDGYLKFNSDGIPYVYSLFPSLKRKLFYNHTRIDGDLRWYLNNDGVLFKYKHISDCILSFENKFKNYELQTSKKLNINVFDLLFNHGRLQSGEVKNNDDVLKLIVSSSTCYEHNSLRNYSSIDRSFIHKSIFTKKDFGSRKRGFSLCNILKQVHHVKDISSDTFLAFEDFCKFSNHIDSIDKEYSQFLEWQKMNGDKKLAVARHNERLKNLYKTINLI